MRACGISLFKMPPGLVAIFASAWARIKSPAGSAMPRSTASPPSKNWRTVRRLSVVGSLLSSSIFTLGSSLVSVVHCTALRGRWRGQMAVQISRVGQRAFHREDVIVLAPFYVFPPTPVIKFGSEEMKAARAAAALLGREHPVLWRHRAQCGHRHFAHPE